MSSIDAALLSADGAGRDAPPPKRARLDALSPSAGAPSAGAPPSVSAPSTGAPLAGAPSAGAPSVGVPSVDAPSRADELRARLPHLAATWHAVKRARTLELIALAERTLLSPAEEVLAIPYLSKRSVMGFLTQSEALPLRAACVTCRDAVAEHAWDDWEPGTFVIRGSIASWRRCFPHAIAADLGGNKTVQNADLVHLRGVCKVRISGCKQITDAGLAHLRGIHTLHMNRCTAVTDVGLAHLRGIHSLHMSHCTAVTDTGLAHLRGIHTLSMDGCMAITDAGLAHLRDIYKLRMERCSGITNAGLVHLHGIRVLRIKGPRLTTAALAQLVGAPPDIRRS